jgi:hypothetical protein
MGGIVIGPQKQIIINIKNDGEKKAYIWLY